MNERKISNNILVAGWRRRRPPDSAGPGHVSRRGDAAPRDWTRDLCHVCRGQAGARADVRGRGPGHGGVRDCVHRRPQPSGQPGEAFIHTFSGIDNAVLLQPEILNTKCYMLNMLVDQSNKSKG